MARATSNPSKDSIVRKLHGFESPAVILSCEKSFNKLKIVNDYTLFEAFRQSWECEPLKRERTPTVAICHIKGVIKKVYKDLVWTPTLQEDVRRVGFIAGYIEQLQKAQLLQPTPGLQEQLRQLAMLLPDSGRWNFTGNEAWEHIRLLGVDLASELTQRGMNNPVRYLNC